MHVRVAMVYHITKFKSANNAQNTIWGKIAKFNDCQYIWLYDKSCTLTSELQAHNKLQWVRNSEVNVIRKIALTLGDNAQTGRVTGPFH